MNTLESKIENDAVDLIYQWLGIISIKLNTSSGNGWPDRLFWIPGGKPFLIEFKRPGEDPEPLQEQIHKNLIELDYHIEVHDNAIDAFEATINFVESTRLSKASRKVLARARRRCAVLRSRIG